MIMFLRGPDVDWFSDLKLAADIPISSFRLCMRADPPAVFWSMLFSAIDAMPLAVRDISIVATDLVPNGFNELVKPAQWSSLASSLKRFESLETFGVTFAGMDDFRLSVPARKVFGEDFGRALKEREKLFAAEGVKASVRLGFVLDPEGV